MLRLLESTFRAITAGAVLCVLLVGVAAAQENVGIGTSTPDASALLDLTSSSKGFLAPRLSRVQRDQIVLPAKGLIIFNTTSNEFEFNSGTPQLPVWSRFISVNGGDSGNDFWSTKGNTIDAATNFLGSTNNAPLLLKTNNQTRLTITAGGMIESEDALRIKSNGLLLDGTTAPIQLNGDAGTAGDVLVSAGPGTTPLYTDSLALRGVSAGNLRATTSISSPTFTGPTTFTGAVTFTSLPQLPLEQYHFLIGNAADFAEPFSPGANGTVLGVQNGSPTWIDLAGAIRQQAWNIGGNDNPSSAILGNTATTGMRDLDIRAGNQTMLFLNGATRTINVQGSLNLQGAQSPLLLDGDAGQQNEILVSAGPGNTPQWTSFTSFPVWRLSGNAAIGPNDVLGTTDANDVRIATNGQVRLTVAQGTGNVSLTSLAGAAQASPSGASESVVVADANGTLRKRGKDALFALFGIVSGRYVNNTGNPQFSVVISLPANTTVDAQASITLTPEASTSVGITPFVVNGSRTSSTFTINFPGGLNPGEAINWMVMNP
ncbi:MAG: hypothetical protein MUC47_03820 [Candidatus Kapabacteria bacterium]|nr:hypothetical protein [Candidatus Kapabacteria bacterium]